MDFPFQQVAAGGLEGENFSHLPDQAAHGARSIQDKGADCHGFRVVPWLALNLPNIAKSYFQVRGCQRKARSMVKKRKIPYKSTSGVTKTGKTRNCRIPSDDMGSSRLGGFILFGFPRAGQLALTPNETSQPALYNGQLCSLHPPSLSNIFSVA
jgi:hypothetical protein